MDKNKSPVEDCWFMTLIVLEYIELYYAYSEIRVFAQDYVKSKIQIDLKFSESFGIKWLYSCLLEDS